MTVTAQQVKELRDRTGLGMMACKKALVETDGNPEAAIELLRKKGALKAAKKAERTAADGSVAIVTNEDGTCGAMIEFACETDFVARNAEFAAAAEKFAGKVLAWDLDGTSENLAAFDPEGQISGEVEGLIAKMGENMRVNAETRGRDEVAALARDICMQIASLNPIAVRTDQVPANIVEQEKAIYREQVKDKPEKVQEKIVAGKLRSYFKDCVLLEQPFVKEPKKSVRQHIAEAGKQAGGEIEVVRFVRFQVGQ